MTARPLPTVGVVIPTRDRPQLLRRAIGSVLDQDYRGRIEVLVVHDGTGEDHSVAADGERPVRVTSNTRKPGLAGSRNTGILGLKTDYVAFLDDDDYWLPEKVSRQVDRAQQPDAPELVTCSIAVDYEGRSSARYAGTDTVTEADLARSILAMLHSSCLFFERDALLDPDRIGLVNEEIPGSQNEDWDIKLRAAARKPIAHIDEPLTHVQWGRASMFARRWETKNASLKYMLQHFPVIERDRKGASRVYGQLAFGEAASGNRDEAKAWAWRALRAYPLQWRAIAALPVLTKPERSDRILNFLHRFGRGV